MLYRRHFGDSTVGVEVKKKENRSLYGMEINMEEFLDVSL